MKRSSDCAGPVSVLQTKVQSTLKAGKTILPIVSSNRLGPARTTRGLPSQGDTTTALTIMPVVAMMVGVTPEIAKRKRVTTVA
jgi:hypothetical protein